MRIRRVFAFALCVWGGAIFWACGDTSFGNGDATDDGGVSDANGADGSNQKDGASGNEGGTSGDGGGDACTPPIIPSRGQNDINCPGADSGGDGTSTCSQPNFCCVDDGTGTCQFLSCSGGNFNCEKSSDCSVFNGRCCLDYAFDTTGCPERTVANGSTCASTACNSVSEHTLCASSADCLAAEAGASCTPVEVDYNGTDASTLLGYCTP